MILNQRDICLSAPCKVKLVFGAYRYGGLGWVRRRTNIASSNNNQFCLGQVPLNDKDDPF